MGFFDRLIGRKDVVAEEKSNGGGYDLPVSGGWLPGNSSWNFWQRGYDVQPLSNNPVVSACVDAYAQTIASMWVYHVRKQEDGGTSRLKNTPLSRVLRHPNGYQTRSDFMLNAIQSLFHTGNLNALCFRDDRNEIESMHLVNPRGTTPMIDAETGSVFYNVGENPMIANQNGMVVPARDMLHIRLHTPRHPLIGVSPIALLASSIAANNAITRSQASFFNNMSRPSGILTTDAVMNKTQLIQLREAWENQSSNLNSGGIPVLNGGLKFTPMSITSQDAQLVQAFNMSVEDIARVFRVPLPLVGDQRQSTYNNVEQLSSLWLSGGLGFIIEHIERGFDMHFDVAEDTVMEYDVDTLLRTDFAGRIDALTKGISGGLYSPNEGRRKEGLPEVEFGDEPRTQMQNMPLSYSGLATARMEQGDPAPVNVPAPDQMIDDPEAAKAIAIHQIKKAMSA